MQIYDSNFCPFKSTDGTAMVALMFKGNDELCQEDALLLNTNKAKELINNRGEQPVCQPMSRPSSRDGR